MFYIVVELHFIFMDKGVRCRPYHTFPKVGWEETIHMFTVILYRFQFYAWANEFKTVLHSFKLVPYTPILIRVSGLDKSF